MKILFVILSLFLSISTLAQDNDKIVTLVVSGQGNTIEEAKQNALRSAIELAFGTFISSKTEILNDNLIKDEIVSVANGNIQKFEIISEVQMPEGGYATSLKATVSVTKLTSFVENKGFEVEFRGSLFAANIRQQKLNEDAELKAILDLCEVSNSILRNSLDYSIEVSEPTKAKATPNFKPQPDEYQILLTVIKSPNANFDIFKDYFLNSIRSIAMSESEMNDYKDLNKDIYRLELTYPPENLYFRNPKTYVALQNFFLKSNKYLHNFIITSNIDTIEVKTCCKNNEDQNIATFWKWDVHNSEKNSWYLNNGNVFHKYVFNSGRPGFPFFTFQVGGEFYTSSWDAYIGFVRNITNSYSKFFNPEYYYSTNMPVYLNEIKVPVFHGYHPHPYIIGILNLSKRSFSSGYLAIYSIDDLSKITGFYIKQL